MTDPRELFWTASRLLGYPSGHLWEELPEIERSVAGLSGPARARLARFLGHLRSGDPLAIEEEYVRTFDMSDRTPLYLTYSREGDDRGRGAALAALKERYRAAGLDPAGSEIPDYLPMVLEFLAVGPSPSVGEVARDVAPAVQGLASELEAAASPYADVVAPVANALRALARDPLPRWWGR